jgi:pimeloyl-ACP methyl ester carboxylesterase
MNPNFVHEGPAKRQSRLLRRLRPLFLVFIWIVRLLTLDLFGSGGAPKGLRVDIGTRFSRFIRGLCYRLLFLPLLMALAVMSLVYSGTHPPAVASAMDPTCHGIYYDPVNFVADDGTPLEAWLLPAVDARRVIEQKESALGELYPAVVLVHDFGASRQQMLPLATPLHNAGYVVLMVGLRGNASDGAAAVGQTFGLNEAADVKAAVELLRKTPFVDGQHIAVLGLGTGATAALLAAQRDATIAAVVLDRPSHSFDDILREHLAPSQPWLAWMAPFCQWTFEIAYKVNATDVNLDHNMSRLQSRGVLLFDGPAPATLRGDRASQIVDFLNINLKPKKPAS